MSSSVRIGLEILYTKSDIREVRVRIRNCSEIIRNASRY